MKTLVDCLQLEPGVISLVGSGGKTSLLHLLAEQLPAKKILLSTTTKMGYPDPGGYDHFYQADFEGLGQAEGITMAGLVTEHDGRKKISQPQGTAFSQSFSRFEYVLLEADGSKRLPLKGWADFEPVILPETTTTIGLLPLAVLGQSITAETVYRLPLFLQQTETQLGEPITLSVLQQVIESSTGLFKNAKGKKILLLNQVESPQMWEAARTLAGKLTKTTVDQIVAGSIQQNKGVIL